MAKHSPLPWRLAPGDNPPDFSRTVDARDCFVFGDNSGPKEADAVLIVEAVNGRKRDEAVKAIDPHALPPFHEEYAVKMHGHIWKGDSEEDFELLKTYDGARKLVERMDAEDVMQGFWDHPAREIVRRVVGEWEDA